MCKGDDVPVREGKAVKGLFDLDPVFKEIAVLALDFMQRADTQGESVMYIDGKVGSQDVDLRVRIPMPNRIPVP